MEKGDFHPSRRGTISEGLLESIICLAMFWTKGRVSSGPVTNFLIFFYMLSCCTIFICTNIVKNGKKLSKLTNLIPIFKNLVKTRCLHYL